ncbi:hypothetical protein WA026_008654 [Henosepilachna vigintioctopunctata]|uniref:2-aminoethanethiol dioxygenase n=1 Tax=Henosepilachna vigintioctopunctata TaxID=420089 RepID=A0AAW1UL69_9CUCU
MLGQINVVLKQALETFTCRREVFHQNIEKLKHLMNNVTIDDVRLNPALLSSNIWQKPNKAPATYVDIFQDNNVTMGIFVLKPDMTLPLHDHPDMHGVIKVIFGKIKITSYSVNSENISTLGNYSNQMPTHKRSHLIVEKDSEITMDSSSSCCILYPNHKNFHEIQSIGGPAAFMDILSPPYETLSEDGEVRRCNYYKVLSEIAPNIFHLQKVDSPSYFWTDSAPFLVKV